MAAKYWNTTLTGFGVVELLVLPHVANNREPTELHWSLAKLFISHKWQFIFIYNHGLVPKRIIESEIVLAGLYSAS